MKGLQHWLEYFTCARINDIIYMQYFDREDSLGHHIFTRKDFQPLTRVTISLTTTALLCALHNLCNGTGSPGSPILFDSTVYKGTSELQNVNKNKKQSLTGNITTGHYERFEGTWANMTTRRAERITAFCLDKISR